VPNAINGNKIARCLVGIEKISAHYSMCCQRSVTPSFVLVVLAVGVVWRLCRRQGGFGGRRCGRRLIHEDVQRNGRLWLAMVTGCVLVMRDQLFAMRLVRRVVVMALKAWSHSRSYRSRDNRVGTKQN
jgi:hypothetical protein